MKGCTGEIIFACGRKYTEVPQKVINELKVGLKMCVYDNGESHKNCPDPWNPHCLECPCKRKAKRKKDRCFRREDRAGGRKNGKPIKTPTGIFIKCAIAELKPSVK